MCSGPEQGENQICSQIPWRTCLSPEPWRDQRRNCHSRPLNNIEGSHCHLLTDQNTTFHGPKDVLCKRVGVSIREADALSTRKTITSRHDVIITINSVQGLVGIDVTAIGAVNILRENLDDTIKDLDVDFIGQEWRCTGNRRRTMCFADH